MADRKKPFNARKRIDEGRENLPEAIELRKKTFIEDMRVFTEQVLSSSEGRRWMWWLLDQEKCYGDNFRMDAKDPWERGQRQHALNKKRFMMKANAALYQKMEMENSSIINEE